MKKNVCICMADGSEEMETVITADVLRRGGLGVFLAGVGETRLVTASRGVRLAPDGAWDAEEAGRFCALIIPGGGGGVETLAADESVRTTVRTFLRDGRLVAAICAGPLVLQAAGVLNGRRFTCHPAVTAEITSGTYVDAKVVRDENLITSQGPGTTFEFALAVLEVLTDSSTARKVATDMLLSP